VGINENISKQVRKSGTNSWKATVKGSYVFILLIIVVVILSLVKMDSGGIFGRGHFLNWDGSVVNLLRNAVPILTLSGGFTLLMISGNIDLSVGSALSLSAVIYSLMILNGFGLFLSFIITMILGIVLGFVNGLLVMKLRITPVIATLVTLNLYKGIARLIVPPGISAIKSGAEKTMPAWINNYARKDILIGLPVAFFVAIVIIVILVIAQRKTILGKYSVAIGGNRLAAELSGINAVKIGWMLYIMVGLLAALAGIARASYMSIGDPLTGDGMELDCIIAVLLGGTAFSGGEGSVIKTIAGALIIMCITTGLMTVIPPYWQMFTKGTVLVLAVTLNSLLVREKVLE
jgi:ribose/xylose/arabinose/galactoside ABC-type transport system permease subunit